MFSLYSCHICIWFTVYTGVYKVAFPPPPHPGGNGIKLLGKKIKLGRREGNREERKGKGIKLFGKKIKLGRREGEGKREERKGKGRGKKGSGRGKKGKGMEGEGKRKE